MNRRLWLALAVVVAVLTGGLAWSRFATHNAPTTQPPLAHLDAASLDTFRADFNAASRNVRIIVLLSPT